MARPPFRLVDGLRSADTVALLTELLDSARRGDVLGLAIVSIRKSRSFAMHVTGEAARSPTFTLGTVTKLQADLAAKVNDEAL